MAMVTKAQPTNTTRSGILSRSIMRHTGRRAASRTTATAAERMTWRASSMPA